MKSELEHHYILWSRPSWAVTLKCNNAYIIVAFDFFQKNRRLRLAVVTWVAANFALFLSSFGNSKIISGGRTGPIFVNFLQDLGGSGGLGGVSGFQFL